MDRWPGAGWGGDREGAAEGRASQSEDWGRDVLILAASFELRYRSVRLASVEANRSLIAAYRAALGLGMSEAGFFPPELRLSEPMSPERALGRPSPTGRVWSPMESAGVCRFNTWTNPAAGMWTVSLKESALTPGWSYGGAYFIYSDSYKWRHSFRKSP